MKLYITDPLFAWNRLDDSPELKTIRDFFALLPDGKLLECLRTRRGRGRNDVPIERLWFCVVLQRLLRHPTMELTLAELRRNPDLRLLGSMDHADQVPRRWNISRFMAVLGQAPYCEMVEQIFAELIETLGKAVPDLGVHTAGDATHLNARRRGQYTGGTPAPDGGRKEYLDDEGTVTKVVEWFGYKLHILCDVRHEVTLSYRVTPASASDNESVKTLVEKAEAVLPEKRIQTLSYDKACDDGKVHRDLNKRKIKPIIHQRNLWKDEQEKVLQGAGIGNVAYDEAGTVYCYNMASDPPVRYHMAYIGHEPSRGTLKYRCPAIHEGWKCPCSARCNKDKKYGMTVRVKREIDLRRFPPVPRATKKFERLYKGRTAAERVIARKKIFWGADDGNIAGGASFMATVGIVMVVHAGLAILLAKSPRKDPRTRLGQTKLSPIARALE